MKTLLACLLPIAFSLNACKANEPQAESDTSGLFSSDKNGLEDESVVFFPTYANYNPATKTWYAKMNAWVGRSLSRPEVDTMIQSSFVSRLQALGLGQIASSNDFYERIKMFFALPSSERVLTVNFNGFTKTLKATTSGGVINGNITFNESELQQLQLTDSNRWAKFSIKNDKGITYYGQIEFVKEVGKTVVSDIDDTLRISNVYQKNIATTVKTVLIDPPQLANGMKQLLTRFAPIEQTQFVYLSGGPTPLYTNLQKLLQTDNQYPQGTYLLREFANWNPTDISWNTILGIFSSEEHKKTELTNLFQRFPQRKFILIGDNGEKDPEIYAWALQNYFQQVEMVYIRNVMNENYKSERLTKAFGQNIAKLKLVSAADGTVQ